MKVKVSFTIDIDPVAWALEYGLDRDEVREDVQSYVEQSVRDWFGEFIGSSE